MLKTVLSTSSTRKKAKTSSAAKPKVPYRTSIPKAISLGKQTLPLQLKNEMVFSGPVPISVASTAYFNKQSVPVNAMFTYKPTYFAQLAALYGNYTVTNSKMEVQASGTAGVASRLGIFIDDDTSTVLDFQQGEMKPGAVTRFYNATQETAKVMKYWNASTAFAGDPLSNQDLMAEVTTDPTATQYYTILVANLDGVSATYYVNIKLTYTCTWDNLKTVF